MRTRQFVLWIVFALLLALAGCRAPAAPEPGAEQPPAGMPPAPGNEPAPASVTIQTVQVDTNAGKISVSGHSALPDDEGCLQVRLLQDGQPLAWWPAEPCVKVTGGAWELTVPLPAGALQPDTDYELRAAIGGAEGEGVFWFDLNGPHNPEK